MENIKVRFWGKLYNGIKLKKKVGISQDSSTEKLIESLYQMQGIDFLDDLEGGFAGVIEDINKKEYYLFRDKIGIKNIYYAKYETEILYSASLEKVYQKIDNTTVNIQAVYDYMTLCLVPGRDTLYTNIFKVRAGCYIRIDDSSITEHSYWNVTEHIKNNSNPYGVSNICKIQSRLYESLTDITNSTQKPIGLLLSDGIDSNLIAELLNDIRINFSAYTMASQGSSYQKLIEKRIHALKIKKADLISFEQTDILNFLNSIAEPYPFTDVYVIKPLLEKMYLCGISVCLTGEGADELGGYNEYIHMARLAQLLNEKKHIKYENTYEGKYISGRHIPGFTEYEKAKMFVMPSKFESSYRIISNIMYEIDGNTIEDMYNKFLNLDLKLRLPELLLHRLDIISLQFNINLAFPFLGESVVEEILRQPRTAMIGFKDAKKVFKSILNKYVNIDDYFKMGFGETYALELAEQTRSLYSQELKAGIEKQPICDFVKPEAAKEILEKNDRKAWLIFSLNNWLKEKY